MKFFLTTLILCFALVSPQVIGTTSSMVNLSQLIEGCQTLEPSAISELENSSVTIIRPKPYNTFYIMDEWEIHRNISRKVPTIVFGRITVIANFTNAGIFDLILFYCIDLLYVESLNGCFHHREGIQPSLSPCCDHS